MTTIPEPKPSDPVDTQPRAVSNQVHAISEALERALEILNGHQEGEDSISEALGCLEPAYEVARRLDMALYAEQHGGGNR